MSTSANHQTRRRFLVSSLAACTATACAPLATERDQTQDLNDVTRMEQSLGGRIGFAAINLRTGATLSHRSEERFAMCSTFKWFLAAAVLFRADQNIQPLDARMSWSATDLISWSPVTKPLIERSPAGRADMSLEALCQATLRTSDNTAANLLLEAVGGPTQLTRWLRSLDDDVTRLDRWEPALNENAPGDPRDTTTPTAMLNLLSHILYGRVLSHASRAQLKLWMIANETGHKRLRAGIPDNWIVGDRTGTSLNNASNAVAFAEADAIDGDGPVLIVSFTNAPDPMSDKVNQHHAALARSVFSQLT